MKKPLLLFAILSFQIALSQVPLNGVVSDDDGNIYVAIHAPSELVLDGFPLPISQLRTNYLVKLDANGDLTDIKHVEGAADKAGTLKLKGDTLIFSQGHFYANDGGDEVNKSEIVLTKMSTEMDRIFTVTIPLPNFGRPLAVDYENNYWYVAYAYMGQHNSEDKPNLALAGIRHNYSDGWIKQISAKTISDLWLEEDKLWCLGTYSYTLRWGNRRAEVEGIDYFIGEVDKTSGNALEVTPGNTGQVLHAARFFHTPKPVIGGSVLLEGKTENLEQLFIGKMGRSGEVELFTKAGNLDNSRITNFIPTEDGGYTAIGNFSASMRLGRTELVSKGQQDVFAARFDSEGKILWVHVFGTTLNDEALSLITSTEGSTIIAYQKRDAGYADVQASFFEAMPPSGEVSLVKIGADGSIVWEKSIEANRPN